MWRDAWREWRWAVGVRRHPVVIVLSLQVGLFIAGGIVRLGGWLADPGGGTGWPLVEWMGLPASPPEWVRRPWTLLTYALVHRGVFHLLFNALLLYWFARIFTNLVGFERLWAVMVGGTVTGGLAYWGLMGWLGGHGYLIGGSAMAMAVMTAAATLAPFHSIYLLFFGSVRIVYVVAALLILDVLLIPGGNPGGHLAHLGGALWGFAYVRWLQGRLPRRPSKPIRQASQRPRPQADDVDRILEKIVREGMDSLSDRERQILEDASKRYRKR